MRSLTPAQTRNFQWDWRGWWARPDQLAPPGAWSKWLILAGRGYGKTRVLSEWVREGIEKETFSRVALVAPTAADARDVMVEGPSGILTICPDWNRPLYEPSRRKLTWPNGAIAITYSADEPERLRGPQHDAAGCDELAAWRYPEAWDMLMFGLRLGNDPRCAIATTPRPVKLLKELLAREGKDVRVTRGSTYENSANLAPTFFKDIVAKYEGTRLGRQELLAEMLTDIPNALWQRSRIDELRVLKCPELTRIVVAIDPAAKSEEGSDETGIVVAGLGRDKHGYILDDLSGQYQPLVWARKAIKAYKDRKADRIVAEINNGGEMVEATLRTVDAAISYKAVHATRGKVIRAEPIAAFYEQGKVHHVGSFPKLEDQLCFPAGTLIETRRGDVPIELIAASDQVMTRAGWRTVEIACYTGCSSDFVVIETTNGERLRCTPNHLIFDLRREKFVAARSVPVGMLLDVRRRWDSMGRRLRGGGGGITECQADIFAMQVADFSIARYGRLIVDSFPVSSMCTTRTRTQETIVSAIWNCFPRRSILRSMHLEASVLLTLLRAVGIRNWRTRNASDLLSLVRTAVRRVIAPGSVLSSVPRLAASGIGHDYVSSRNDVCDAERYIRREIRDGSIAVKHVTMLRTTPESVFNLRVIGRPEYYANGILVHNCEMTLDFDRISAGYSPDRLDAAVWALTELMGGSRSFFG